MMVTHVEAWPRKAPSEATAAQRPFAPFSKLWREKITAKSIKILLNLNLNRQKNEILLYFILQGIVAKGNF